jgi:hypothetical protein
MKTNQYSGALQARSLPAVAGPRPEGWVAILKASLLVSGLVALGQVPVSAQDATAAGTQTGQRSELPAEARAALERQCQVCHRIAARK